MRLHLAKDILTIQEQDVICVSGEPFYSGVSIIFSLLALHVLIIKNSQFALAFHWVVSINYLINPIPTGLERISATYYMRLWENEQLGPCFYLGK